MATSAPAHASGVWSVEAASGRVLVSEDGAWRALGAGEGVAVGKWLKTGNGARVTLRRGGSTIALEPNSLVAVAGVANDPDATVLQQRWGSSTLDVEKRERPHFRVQTPFLAAVVKGTTLRVNAERRRSTIAVDKGWVAMTDEARGLECEAWSGVSVSAGAGPKGRMRAWGEGRWTKPQAVAKRMPTVAPSGRSKAVGPNWIDPTGRSTAAPMGEAAYEADYEG